MINFDDVTVEIIIVHNSYKLQIHDHPCKILITDGS